MVPQIQPHVPSTATILLWTLLLPRAFSVAFLLVFLPPRSPSPPGLLSSRENLSRPKSGGHHSTIPHPPMAPTYLAKRPS